MTDEYKKGVIDAMSMAINEFNAPEWIREGVFERMNIVLRQPDVIKSGCEHQWEQNMRYDNVWQCKKCGEEKCL